MNPDLLRLNQIHSEFIANRSDVCNIQDWKLIITQDEIAIMVQHLADYINYKFQHDKIVVTCILKGCAYFLVDLTKKLTIPHSLYFIETSLYHDKQVPDAKVELLSILVPSKFQGRKVILLDELYDNGFTLHAVKTKLIEEVKLDPQDIVTCTLFHKCKHGNLNVMRSGGNPYDPPDLVGFWNLPDLWYVGYGLDDKQEKRNWPHLYAIPKLPDIPKNTDDSIFESSDEGLQKYQDIRQRIIHLMDRLKLGRYLSGAFHNE